MKVKLTTGRVGNGFSQASGEIIEVSQAEGQRLIQAGQAEAAIPENKATSKGKKQ